MMRGDTPFVVNACLDSDFLGHPSLFIDPRIPEERSISTTERKREIETCFVRILQACRIRFILGTQSWTAYYALESVKNRK